MFVKNAAPCRRIALLGATALVAGLASPLAYAQNTTAPVTNTSTGPATGQASTPSVPEATEQIEVTGTRIQNTNANSANPITVITSKEIAQSSAQTIEDVLQKSVSFGSNGIYGQTNNGGDGVSCTDLRGLGVDRVLVLVDGQRFVHDSDVTNDCVDLNNIPLQMVDHIDVLKDGASSLYGADAVAGVVNIVLKKNISGSTATLQGELPTRRGGTTGELSDTTGVNFDKGNLSVGIDYLTRAAISQGSRNWANRIDPNDKFGDKTTQASGFVPGGNVIPLNDSSNSYLAHTNGTFTPFTGADKFNFAPYQDLVGSLEKESITTVGHYDINEYMTAYVNAYFTHKFTSEQLAPEPIYAVGPSQVLPQLFVVPFGAPGNTGAIPGETPTNLLLLQRGLQFGPREYQQTTNTFEINVGIKGVLPYDITYDTYYNYGVSDNTLRTKNSVNVSNYEKAVGYQFDLNSSFGGLNGTFNPALCPANIGCQNFTNLSPAAINYIKYTETDTSSFRLRTFGGDISKKDVFQLPYGGLGLAFGFDHREEHGQYTQDNLVQTGETNETAGQPTDGGFSVSEVYGEARIPILADLPFAKELTADISGRFFSYNTFGTGETWKVGGNWTPIEDIRFRANIGTAFRQPSVSELFLGQTTGAESANDPCLSPTPGTPAYYNGYATASQRAIAAANCRADGVRAGQVQLGNSQITTLLGGNPNLQPETARTETVGMVVKPRYIPNSAFTVDFFRTKIENTINNLAAVEQTVLDNCYQSVNETNPLCANLGPTAVPGQAPGTASRAALSQLTQLQGLNQNLGETETNGIDFGVTYNFPLFGYGALSENNQLAWVMKYQQQNYNNAPFTQYNGVVEDSLAGQAFPRIRDNNTITWTNGPLVIGYTTRFISGMDFQNHNSPSSVIGQCCRVVKTTNIIYHDIEGSYSYGSASMTVGVDNILDQTPPFVPDGTTNTAPQIYDVVGRVVYAKATIKF